MNESIECWHFASADRRLGYEDGRLIEVGAIHKVDVTPKCCVAGLHGSIRAIDALDYAAGPIISRVRIWGLINKKNDKLCGQAREYLAVDDATEELFGFARWCALQVIHLWDAPQVMRQYLETGDESIRAIACDAARAAAWDAETALYAAWDAARAAARAIAWDAETALSVAWATARAAARAAGLAEIISDRARSTARAAARDTQNAELDHRLRKLLKLEAA
jgi:cell division septum initiation protein DivIVA